jgi:hypothetical protein
MTSNMRQNGQDSDDDKINTQNVSDNMRPDNDDDSDNDRNDTGYQVIGKIKHAPTS